jgi:hypothetical protein
MYIRTCYVYTQFFVEKRYSFVGCVEKTKKKLLLPYLYHL